MQSTPCPQRDQLLGYVLGKLSEDQSESLADHLNGCPRCQATLDGLSDNSDTLVSSLHRAGVADPFEQEPELARVLSLVAAIGQDMTPPRELKSPSTTEAVELGTIRDYQLLSQLGQGGMGTVYKALHMQLEKVVALKVLPADRLQDARAVERFKREMKAVGRLEHAHIVSAHDAGQHGDVHFLVMEYVQGVDLSNLVKRHGPLAIADACELVRQAAVGLAHANQQGLVHRDIKPSNLMLSTAGQVKILDFGLARLQINVDACELTADGQMMGTIDYMAPEQGTDSHEVDIRADIYSLGATLYKLLCGEAPFGGARYDTPMKRMIALATQQPQPITECRPDVPPALAAIVHRMLAKNPDDRFAHPAEIAAALVPFAVGGDLARLLADAEFAAVKSSPAEASITTDPKLESASISTSASVPTAKSSATHGNEATQTFAASVIEPVSSRQPSRRNRWIAAAAAGAAALVLLAAVIVKIETRDGTLVLTVDGPKPLIKVDGETAQVSVDESGKVYRVSVKPGTHTLLVTTPEGLRFEADEKFEMAAGATTKIAAKLQRKTIISATDNVKPRTISTSTTEQETDPNYAVAKWVLSVGGGMRATDARGKTLDSWRPFPQLPFVINHIALDDCAIKDGDMLRIRGLKKIYALDLRRTQISDIGVQNLEGLEIARLTLTGTKITGNAIKSLKASGASLLEIENTKAADGHLKGINKLQRLAELTVSDVDDTCAANLAGAPALTSLNIQSGPELTEVGFEHLAKISGLKGLLLYDVPVSDEALAQLAKLPALESLILPAFKITGKGAEFLGRMTHLQRLIMSDHEINDAGMEHLGKLKNLQFLEMPGGSVGDSGLIHLSNLKSLRHFLIRAGPGITPEGMARLRRALPDCTEFGWDPINPHRSIAEYALRNGGTVHIVGEEERAIESIEELPQGSFSVFSLSVNSRNGGRGRQAPAVFPIQLGLRTLELEGMDFDDSLVGYLEPQTMTSLSLAGNPITDASIEKLKTGTKLKRLDLRETQITESGIAKLKAALPGCKIEWSNNSDRALAEWIRSKGGEVNGTGLIKTPADIPPGDFSLTGVSFNLQPENIHDDDLARFAHCSALSYVNLTGSRITSAGVKHLAGHKSLKWLDLSGTLVGDDVFDALETLPALEHLSIGPGPITSKGWERIVQLRKLVDLDITNTGLQSTPIQGESYVTDAQVAQWISLPLEHLRLTHPRITENAFLSIAKMSSLKELNVLFTGTFDESLGHLQELKKLERVCFVYTTLTDRAIGDLARSSNEIQGLGIITLQGVNASPEALEKMRREMSANCSLEWKPPHSERCFAEYVLRHGGSLIDNDNGVPAAAAADLPDGDVHISSISLANSKIEFEGELRFLASMPQLAVLDLAQTGVGDGVVEFLPKTLTRANLSGNPLTDLAVEKLKQATNLKQLDLRETRITETGIAALRTALPNCKIEWSHAAAK